MIRGPITSNQIFGREESLDFSSGLVDGIDFFNRAANVSNEVETTLDIANRAEANSVQLGDIENTEEELGILPEFQRENDFDQEVTFDDTEDQKLRDRLISLRNENDRLDEDDGFDDNQFGEPVAEFKAASGVRVLNKTRDQLGKIKSVRGARFISQDFNDDGTDKKVKGIEIVIPEDASKEERAKAEAWVKQTHAQFKKLGVDVPIRGVKTRKDTGSGLKGFFHLEDHFIDDEDARKAIKDNPQLFADVTARTLGTISGATFINPHEQRGQGATGRDGISETKFSQQYRTPFLQRALSGGPQETRQTSSGSSSDRGDFAFRKEARLDSQGNAQLYNPPSSDKNNKEIAGFGDVTNKKKFNQLNSLRKSGKLEEMNELAKKFMSERGKPFTENIENDTVASVLNGAVHHRGESGFRKILKLAGTSTNKIESDVRRPGFNDRWVEARAKQERENEASVWRSAGKKHKGKPVSLSRFRELRAIELGGRTSVSELGDFGKGLVNRWREEAQLLTN